MEPKEPVNPPGSGALRAEGAGLRDSSIWSLKGWKPWPPEAGSSARASGSRKRNWVARTAAWSSVKALPRASWCAALDVQAEAPRRPSAKLADLSRCLMLRRPPLHEPWSLFPEEVQTDRGGL